MKKNYLLGIFIIFIGIIFLGNNLEIWDINIFFKGWWTLFIIIPSIKELLKKEYVSSLLGITIGILLLLSCNDIIEWNMVGKIFLPVVIIMVGVSILFKSKRGIKDKEKDIYFGIFSGTEEKITKLNKNLTCISIFGGIDLDLRNTKIEKDVKIECISIFGGTDIHLPSNVCVKSSGIPILGGFENKNNTAENAINTIYIDYVCIFGGVDVL